ncbi:helix-turn-helix domain-containing protein [Streptococcus ruminicola]|uniref:helix-turn-helix domain-containing protein n=1 Tax=Streptococcus ruminicola TaxID=2686210 RepID=UPI0012FCEF7F|nr:hypothetical protein [Streptococcus ruminicola]QGX01537.1 hypothetical protein GO995_09240 [Streptococcus ruminicola]
MKFELFKQLYSEALEGKNLELYVSERGWQEWMDDYSQEKIKDILNTIHTLANNNLKNTRRVSRAEFSRRYHIPIRTLEDWENEKRTPPIYVKMLIDYVQFTDYLNKD